MKTIVIDVMGGDNGSKPIVDAILKFKNENEDFNIVAVGKKEELFLLEGVCEIVDAPDVVPMSAGALEVMRMKSSSMFTAISYMKEHNADAVISCGSTGGFLAASTITLKMIPGVKRAALVAPFPTAIKGKKVVILDIGASNENSAEELVQFANMGRAYAQSVYKVEKPNVYLLSNGLEEEKGSPEVKEAHKILSETNFEGFKGNVEARNALNGEADVIVTDGFSGNIFLKGSEGVAKMMSSMLNDAFKKKSW